MEHKAYDSPIFAKKTLKNVLRSKKQKTDAYIRKQGPVTVLFENDTTDILIKGIRKQKRSYILYVTNEEVVADIVSLLLCKSVSEQMGLHCHESHKLFCSDMRPFLKVVADHQKPYLGELWNFLSSEKCLLLQYPSVPEDQMPNLLFYWCSSMKALFCGLL
eukprot:TRINITY_DN11350_c0_g1_i2.p1 TRINITY_DN11350_c0_g1~~TRINITY_DN11350_c0_g1_i2.p1  ORF type:complete len:161 (+),score=26.61 TRINITY_DN11350_c0_g1_i2:63-545(+)